MRRTKKRGSRHSGKARALVKGRLAHSGSQADGAQLVHAYAEKLKELEDALAARQAENSRLRQFLVEKERYHKDIINQYEQQLSKSQGLAKGADSGYVEQLQKHIESTEKTHGLTISELQAQLEASRAEINRLKNFILEKDVYHRDILSQYESQLAKHEASSSQFNLKLKEFEAGKRTITPTQVEKLKSYIERAENIYGLTLNELRRQLAKRDEEVLRAKRFLAEKEVYNSNLMTQYEDQLYKKEDMIASLNLKLKDFEKQMEGFSQEAEGLRHQLRTRELLNKKVSEQVLQLKEHERAMSAEIEALRQKLTGEGTDFRQLRKIVESQQEQRIKEIVKGYTEEKIGLMSEIERLKGEIKEKADILEERQRLIDQTIAEFETKAASLLSLRGIPMQPAAQAAREPVGESAQNIIKNIEEERGRWAEERDYYQKQLERLQRQLEQRQEVAVPIPSPLPQPVVAPVIKPEPKVTMADESRLRPATRRETAAPLEKLEKIPLLKSFKAAKTQKTKLMTAPQKAPSHTELRLEATSMFAGERAVFSETDEIESMINVALQQGDRPEDIKESLINSGYPKEKVDEAIRKLRVAA